MFYTSPDPATLPARQKLLVDCLLRGWTLGDLSLPSLPLEAACAMAANATVENQCKSITTGTLDHGSDGLFQDRLDRLSAMQAFGNHYFGTWEAIEPQAAFAVYELTTKFPGLLADLRASTKSLGTLTANFEVYFERPKSTADVSKRIKYAVDIYTLMHGEAQPQPGKKVGAVTASAVVGTVISTIVNFGFSIHDPWEIAALALGATVLFQTAYLLYEKIEPARLIPVPIKPATSGSINPNDPITLLENAVKQLATASTAYDGAKQTVATEIARLQAGLKEAT